MKRKHSSNATSKKPKQIKSIQENDSDSSDETDGLSSLVSTLASNKKVLSNFISNEIKCEETIDNHVKEEEEIADELTEEESESDADNSGEEEIQGSTNDPFKIHFEQDINELVMDKMVNSKLTVTDRKKVSKKEQCDCFSYPEDTMKDLDSHIQTITDNDDEFFKQYHIKEHLRNQWNEMNSHKKKNSCFTAAQHHLFPTIASYQDLYYSNRQFGNGEEIRRMYCLHAVNHVLKSKSRILKNNARLAAAAKEEKEIDDCRDQGLTRPKIIMLVPFRDSCLKIVNNIIKILFKGSKGQVMNKKRFHQEYSVADDEKSSDASKPDDFKQTFTGNIDDCFRIGLNISKKNIKLYCPFYSADIIIASPLGLRTIIGSESEVQEFDFLSSVEMLILDQADIFLMQNWEHLLHIMDHMNKLPEQSRDIDFSRVRLWLVNNRSKFYRQTLLFSSMQTPEINSIFNKYCHNFCGKIKRSVTNQLGKVHHIVNQVPQIYNKIKCDSYAHVADQRFQYFIDRVVPLYRNATSSNIGIFIPSYFDFVRVRNYFKKEEMNFVQISEYSQRSNISRARSMFLEKKKTFILFTERFYFFYRYKIRGIKTLIFYELPHYAQFYSEIVNFMETKNVTNNSENTCTVLFSKFDGCRLENVVGSDRCQQMLVSEKESFMILTES